MSRKVMVGMFLLGALFIFGLATFYIENWQVYLREGYELQARFAAANTLDRGDTVRLAGVSVGTVTGVSVDTETATEMPVTATLLLDPDITVRASDSAEIRMSSLFGGNYVSIVRGNPDAPVLEPGDTISETTVSPSLASLVSTSGKALSRMEETMGKVDQIITRVRDGEGTLGKLLAEDRAYQEVVTFLEETRGGMKQLRDVMEQVRRGEGLLAKLISDPQLAQDVTSTSSNLREISARLKKGEGTVGKLLADEQLYRRLDEAAEQGRRAFTELEKIARAGREGEGLIARLLHDRKLADRVQSLSADLQTTARNLRNLSEKMDRGTFGKLAANDEAYRKLMDTLDSLQQTSQALASGKGTLGMLIQDRELYDTVNRVAQDLQNMLEDYRQQSPVVTFAGSVFGAF